jgi:ATP-dependent DNA helicase RecG
MPEALDTTSTSTTTLYGQPIAVLKGVGPALESRLRKLGIETLQDLLFHLPLRYEDRTRVTPIARLSVGQPGLIEGEVIETRIDLGRRRSLHVTFRDDSGQIGLRYFTFNRAQQARFVSGSRFRCFGEIRMGRGGYEMYHPEMNLLDPLHPVPVMDTLMPVYPVAEGIPQRRMQNLVTQVITMLKQQPVEEWLPETLLRRMKLPSLNEALVMLHQPYLGSRQFSLEQASPARDRLVFEELLAHNLSMLRLRRQIQAQSAAVCKANSRLESQLRRNLSFALTAAQEMVLREVREDLARPFPMLRLVQGDVGSGKTVVAALAALTIVSCGLQCAIMAPTEILAEQHLANMTRWFVPLGFRVVQVAGKQKSSERRIALEAVASGEAHIVVGTHALFQEGVVFQQLALVIVDEQHRFGVHQRLALQEKGRFGRCLPHQLIMTATPIPRTLAMSAYADLDTSVIDELPPGRAPVVTRAVPDSRRAEVIERVGHVCREGRQVYWVCTLIEESDALQCRAAEVSAQQLSEQLPGVSTALVHGRLSGQEKAAVMARFLSNEVQLLVATTVIEVGVDVPNATLMVIENPERLGLAQLHQLRGRVGRGNVQSFCVLLYHAPLSPAAKSRLQTLRESQDGFVIAERDLELRGPGELLGTRQTGVAQFRIADLQRDGYWLEKVREVAASFDEQSEATDALLKRWLGVRLQYAKV